MLRLWNSQQPLPSGLTEKHCPRCDREVNLPLGELCRQCRGEIERRARRISLIVAVVTTIPVAIKVFGDLPDNQTARTVAVVGVVAWFALVTTITRRVVREIK